MDALGGALGGISGEKGAPLDHKLTILLERKRIANVLKILKCVCINSFLYIGILLWLLVEISSAREGKKLYTRNQTWQTPTERLPLPCRYMYS